MKNLKGGYQLIDLEKNDLSSSFTLEGLYQTITLSNNKSLLVTGIVISGVKKNDVYTTAEKSGDDFTFTIYGKTLTIDDEDAVTVADSVSGSAIYKHVLTSSGDTSHAHNIVCYNDDPETKEFVYQYGGYFTKYKGNTVDAGQYFKTCSIMAQIMEAGKGCYIVGESAGKIYYHYLSGTSITSGSYQFFDTTLTYTDTVTKI